MKRQPAKRENNPQRPETIELADLEFVRSEVNLLVFPFFALTTKGLKRRLETEFRAVAERDGERVEILWNVSANPKYGYPGLFDRQVHRAVEQIISEILREKGQVENPIPLGSFYGLCERMGLRKQAGRQEYGGRQYRAIRRALERITTTSIKSAGSFYEKGKRRWTSTVFHLYDAVVFQGEELRDGEIADTNYLYLSDLYLQSLNSFYVKPLDYHYQRSLRSPIASRLYEILGVKFYGVRNRPEAKVCFRYSTLTQLLPVKRYQYLAHAHKQLNPAHEELMATGFIVDYEWREARDDGDWLIFYRPGERARDEIRRAQAERRLTNGAQETLPGMDEEFEAEPVKPSAAAALVSEEDEALVAELVRLNVSESTARELVKHSDPNAIRKWIEAIHYSRAQDKAAFLVKALQENWQVPEEYLKAKEEQEQQERLQEAERARRKKQQQEEEQQQHEAEKLDRLYETLSSEQRADIDRETEARIPPFIQEQIARQRKQGEELSVATTAIIESNRHEVLRTRLQDGRLEAYND
jgi:hypothetical protein